jgi:hypothetical protein
MDVHMFILLKFIIIGFDPAPYSFHHTAILFLPTSLLMDPHKVGDIPFRISLFFLGSGYIPIWWFPIMWLPLRDRLQQRKLILAKKTSETKNTENTIKNRLIKKKLDRKNHKKKQNKNKTLIFLSFLFFYVVFVYKTLSFICAVGLLRLPSFSSSHGWPCLRIESYGDARGSSMT